MLQCHLCRAVLCSSRYLFKYTCVCVLLFFFFSVGKMCQPFASLSKKLQTFESKEKGVDNLMPPTVQCFRSTLGSGDMGILLKPYLNVQLQYLALFILSTSFFSRFWTFSPFFRCAVDLHWLVFATWPQSKFLWVRTNGNIFLSVVRRPIIANPTHSCTCPVEICSQVIMFAFPVGKSTEGAYTGTAGNFSTSQLLVSYSSILSSGYCPNFAASCVLSDSGVLSPKTCQYVNLASQNCP